ncbi:MAG: bifunctional phosphoribosylaminoimidazolecarboxamide formyltransferase/IMP cyclohydrolase [Candidatus Saganbacteria bacterium]|nr:bifunctional phosphoribosylaminoimidazolecarboxamide formyltransferase/IMP cyclohydrolase [Candidatus Saganbacteria bacterium]
MKQQRYAVISVFEKRGIKQFAKGLVRHGFKIIASGGTAKELKKAGIKVVEVSKITKFPEMLDGRVKTLHPKIHGGLLFRRDIPEHVKTAKKYGIPQIDIVVINLYPFEKVISKKNFTHEEAIENIDIGGPAMVRAASKNYEHVAVVTDPDMYSDILRELKENKGQISSQTKERLLRAAFALTSRYDAAILSYLNPAKDTELFPKKLSIHLEKIQDLRYGENPHQAAAFYRQEGGGITDAVQLHGKELSYNNILDIEAAYSIASYFVNPTIAIVKHNNPCGVATSSSVCDAYLKAYKCDKISAYGGIVASNRPIDEKTSKEISKLFVEVVIAPDYSGGAVDILKEKKNLRILKCPVLSSAKRRGSADYKRVSGGVLVQETDLAELTMSDISVVTKRQPSLNEMEDLFFAWGVCKFVKSNAIVVVKNGATIGIGAGQMNRVGSAAIALKQAGTAAKKAVLASDGFFPFADSIEAGHKSGISAVIQPGGSVRDEEVIKAADKYKITMMFTGRRHFRH